MGSGAQQAGQNGQQNAMSMAPSPDAQAWSSQFAQPGQYSLQAPNFSAPSGGQSGGNPWDMPWMGQPQQTTGGMVGGSLYNNNIGNAGQLTQADISGNWFNNPTQGTGGGTQTGGGTPTPPVMPPVMPSMTGGGGLLGGVLPPTTVTRPPVTRPDPGGLGIGGGIRPPTSTMGGSIPKPVRETNNLNNGRDKNNKGGNRNRPVINPFAGAGRK